MLYDKVLKKIEDAQRGVDMATKIGDHKAQAEAKDHTKDAKNKLEKELKRHK